jgi:3-deoxy-manno-octulosonate cytidylyltransferase (CMP-KDO synthetase)
MTVCVAIIPSRFGALRFPGKPLAHLAGKPMVQHVWTRCQEAKCFDRVIIATDDRRIVAAAAGFGAEAELTAPELPSGTDRVASVARQLALPDDAVVLNVQGDEPAIHPTALSTLTRAFSDETVEMGTLIRPLDDAERANPNVVKVVLDESGYALYFSRHDIPFQRDSPAPGLQALQRWAHLGIYGFRNRVLQRVCQLPPTVLERAESLEQLRALGNGIRILCRPTPHASVAVDRPEDRAAAEECLRRLTLCE